MKLLRKLFCCCYPSKLSSKMYEHSDARYSPSHSSSSFEAVYFNDNQKFYKRKSYYIY